MSAPALLVFDGDRPALDAVEAQLERRYGHDYSVASAGDALEAERLLERLAAGGEEVALVLVAKALADATGGALLERARSLHPHAKRGLIVEWQALADPPTAQTILDSIALGRVDYYAAAADRLARRGLPPHDLRLPARMGDRAAEGPAHRPHRRRAVDRAGARAARDLRAVRGAAQLLPADSAEGRALLARAGPGAKLPLMVLPDGRALSDPSNAEIAAAAGTPGDVAERDFDVVIVGAGPAGLSAAVYGASEGLRTLVVDGGGIGGQARSSSLIRNYLGFPRGVSGSRLAEQAYEQASVFGRPSPSSTA